jgi:hypothetical protein
VNARPRIVRTAAAVPAVLLLLLMSGCSHYHIGIPLVPGLSLGLGATKDGNFSVGLNTGFGPLGAGVAVNNGGQVSGSAGVGVGVGPVATGISKGAVLYDPKAGTAAPAGAATSTATAVATTTAAPAAGTVATAAPTAPVAPLPPARTATRVVTPTAAAPLVKITRPPPEPQAPAVNVSYRTPAAAASTVSTAAVRDAGTPGHPIAP